MTSRQIDRAMKARFPRLVAEERAAWRALMSDPAVNADTTAGHTPAIRERWERAADAHRAAVEIITGAAA